MTTNSDLLDLEIGTPPPSTMDVDRIIAQQRSRARMRQAGVGLCVVVMVLVIGAVLVVLPRVGTTPQHIQAVPSPSTATVQPPPDPRQQEAARLSAALKRLVEAALPGATYTKVPPSMPNAPQPDPLVFLDFGNYFEAQAIVTDAAGTGTIRVSVGKEQTQFRSDRTCPEGPYPNDARIDCHVKPAAGGGSMEQLTADIGSDHFRRHYVELIRTDDTAVSVEVSNGVLDENPFRARRPQPLLTLAQVIALVQEPSLNSTVS